jgi:iron complex transport system permease protein
MQYRVKIGLLAVLALVLTALFLFLNLTGNISYILPRRAYKILAIILTGAAIAFSTVVFQTVTNNRILTPSIIGFDSLYLLIQTVIVFIFGSMSLMQMSAELQFFMNVGLMVLFALLLYKFLFRGEGRNIYFLLLVGIIFGTFFGSMSTFMQVLIDPNEFLIIQDRMFASFNNVKTELLGIALIVTLATGVYATRLIKYLDVLSLGREHAVNLGIDYHHVVKHLLIAVAILISVATALVGPITFLGLIVANVTYEFMRTYRHRYLLPGAMLVSVVALVGGQLVVERIFSFSTPLSVIVNLVGGIYFLYLLLRERKSW